jgi:hypothetical protein
MSQVQGYGAEPRKAYSIGTIDLEGGVMLGFCFKTSLLSQLSSCLLYSFLHNRVPCEGQIAMSLPMQGFSISRAPQAQF